MTLQKKTALLVGASGLVGSFCLRLLLQTDWYANVIVVGRKALPIEHPKLRQLVIDFDKLDTYKDSLIADDVYCTLGTTISKAGSRDNFYKVDYTYVVKLAAITSANFASQFLVVSAMGANPDSSFFYNRVKGQMENTVKPMPFLGVHIFQPSLLLGPRPEKRFGESIAAFFMTKLDFLFTGKLKKYKAIPAEDVAKAMLYAAMQEGAGIKIHDSDTIRQEAALLKLS
jgi:uncharacterized protein YbjT (DUF2867 family)